MSSWRSAPRTQAVLKNPEYQAPLIKKAGFREDHTWAYLQWDAAKQDLVPQPLQRHLSQAESRGPFSGTAGECQLGGSVVRFQAHRQLAEEMTGHQLTFQAEIGLRSRAHCCCTTICCDWRILLCTPAHRAPSACATPANLERWRRHSRTT